MTTLRDTLRDHRADVAMTMMVVIWGFNFIIVKDAVTNLAPLTFNALRFATGLPLLALFAWRERSWLHVAPRDVLLIAGLVAIGPLLYQVGFATGIKRTTSTNTALLIATLPTWTAIFSLLMGLVELRRRLLMGIGMTLAGVIIVVLSRSEEGLALSRDDLVGSGLVLGAAVAGGVVNVLSKPVVDRLGSMPMAIWKYVFTWIGLMILAAPDLVHLSSGDIPIATLPNIAYSGMLAGVGGFVFMHLALREIGPTRTTSYFNFNPIVAGLAGIALLGEPFSIWLLIGGGLTLIGVAVVRRNTYLRKYGDPAAAGATAPARAESVPTPGTRRSPKPARDRQ